MDIQIDISGISIETERLLLRPFAETDLADFYTYASVPGVGEMAGWPHHESLETSAKILQSFIAEKEVLAITDKASGRVIGSIGLHQSWASDETEYKDLKVKEIGYVLAREFWGRGLVPEAVRAVIKLCFDTLDLDALTCGHFTDNDQSRRVIEKCGFTFVRQSTYEASQLHQRFEDCKYILLRD